METLKVKLIGTKPLLMHNGQLADPLNPLTRELKALTGANKGKNKTDERDSDVRRAEWLGGLYTDPRDGRIGFPGDVLFALIYDSCKKLRRGKECQAGVDTAEPFFTLTYSGPRTPADLYLIPEFVDYRGVNIGGKKIYRTRPIFRSWSADASFIFDPEIIERRALLQALEIGGARVGLGDWRPRFGQFEVTEI